VLNFHKKVNIFIGDNAQGKTNILESIYLIAITKSHRVHNDENLIKYGSLFTKVKASVKYQGKKNISELEILINPKGKKVSINGNSFRRISDYVSHFNVIIFHPDDLDIVKGSPSVRRKFLNIELGQLENKYLSILNDYNLLLSNRNEYLKHITIDKYDESYMQIINDQLSNKAVDIYLYRKRFITSLNEKIKKINERIKGLDDLSLCYETSIPLDDETNIRELFLNKLNANLRREIILAQTIVGPHRDDFVFISNGKNLKDFGSQGQQRVASLYLKLAEIEIFYKTKKEYPILLLDDIFSELDAKKCHRILKYLNKRMQIMLTTTSLNGIDENVVENSDIFIVDKATVKKKSKNMKTEVK
jgi:DNA replication and repair protein RecF